MASYDIDEVRVSFERLAEEALRGEDVVIAQAGEPILLLVPIVGKADGHREFGQNVLGINYIAPDF
jgi:antitoxin (DNA-binding transcriptional repressor) of toxin-antitoxin stability system